jgi:serine/threonine protein kinase
MNCALSKCGKRLKVDKRGRVIESSTFMCTCCKFSYCSDSCLIEHMIMQKNKEKEKENPINFNNTNNNQIVSSQVENIKAIPTNMKKTLKEDNTSFLKEGVLLNSYSPDPYYDFSNFEKIKIANSYHILGAGAFGEVYLCKNKLDGKPFALKQMDKAQLFQMGIKSDLVYKEINIHIRLIHENIARLYNYHEDDNAFYLIIEYVDNGTLFQAIQKSRGMNEGEAFKYFIQVANAINFLHQHSLIHRDLKPENVLLNRNGEVKLCDFGWTVDSKKGKRITFCGTYEYMAPEIVKEVPYNQMADVWSCGVLLYELLHAFSPFRAERHQVNNGDTTGIVLKNIVKQECNVKKKISSECRDLLEKLLEKKMENRITMKEVFNHPWVKSFENSNLIKKSSMNESLLSEVTVYRDAIEYLEYDAILDQIAGKNKKKTQLTQKYPVPVSHKRKSKSIMNRISTLDTLASLTNKENEPQNNRIILKVETKKREEETKHKNKSMPRMERISPIKKCSTNEVDQSNYSMLREVNEIDRQINGKYSEIDKYTQRKKELNNIMLDNIKSKKGGENLNYFNYEDDSRRKKKLKTMKTLESKNNYNNDIFIGEKERISRRGVNNRTRGRDDCEMTYSRRNELVDKIQDTSVKSEISIQTDRPSFWATLFGYFKCSS